MTSEQSINDTKDKVASTYYERNPYKSKKKDVLYKIVSGKSLPTLKSIEKYEISHEQLHQCLKNLKLPPSSKSRMTRMNIIEDILGLPLTEFSLEEKEVGN